MRHFLVCKMQNPKGNAKKKGKRKTSLKNTNENNWNWACQKYKRQKAALPFHVSHFLAAQQLNWN